MLPKNVLVVDDEEDLRDSVCDVLEDALQVSCRRASSGREALEILGHGGIGIVLTDYKMPGMNGVQLMHEVARIAPKVPILMMTAFPEMDAVIDAMDDPRLEGFFTKPLDPDKIVQAVERALRTK